MKTKDIAFIALMAAVICIIGPFSVPIGVIPVSLTPFAITLAACVLGKWRGTIAVIIYLLIGLAGLPVFSGFAGGPAKLFGPTGGFLLSFFLMAFIGGFFVDKFKNVFIQMAGCALGMCASYAFGTIWLAYQAGMSLKAAFMAAVVPFVAFDAAKIVLGTLAGKAVRLALKKSGLAYNYVNE